MKAVLTHPSWNQIDAGCASLAVSLLSSLQYAAATPTAIVALMRGGVVPAVRLSHMLNGIPVLAVNYSAKTGNGDNRNHINALAAIPDHENILIVDDIVDSGNSMFEVDNYYTNQGHRIISAVLYYKDTSLYEPDFAWQTVPRDSDWIIFPWEQY